MRHSLYLPFKYIFYKIYNAVYILINTKTLNSVYPPYTQEVYIFDAA